MTSKRILPWTLMALAVALVAVVAGPPVYRWAYAAMMPPLLLCEARNDTDTDIAYQLEDATGAFPGDWTARASGAPPGPLSPACFYGPDSRHKPVEVRWGPLDGEGNRYPQRAELKVPRPDDAAVLLLRFTATDRVQARFATAAEMPEPTAVPESVWNSGDWVSQ
ncbi:hypothetical protein [Achromobacter agilis]|uniref:DUF3304 domain-containing protein n=1 Tax=Achromobacter agilis TaxID=1353888 RepID=A0A446C990_9BURK|nr:hypothetical protein [Achromobacter agilis]SSW64492.1 hypothetical protein AGI3411_01590 [Achromobacter agilis]